MLRWSALQDGAAWTDESDGGQEKFWSDSHVSEDFDMSLRLQCAGYQMRFAAYTGISDGFKEGVSLTVNDELARWEKYAFGCSELIFHPLKYWLFRGPITPLFRRFLLSRIHLPKKITILAYIGTYYALGATWLLTLMNYFLTGWFLGHYDKYYLDSFKIWVAIVVVFTGMGNICLGVMRYRLGQKSLISAREFHATPLLPLSSYPKKNPPLIIITCCSLSLSLSLSRCLPLQYSIAADWPLHTSTWYSVGNIPLDPPPRNLPRRYIPPY